MATKNLLLFTKKFPYGHQETYLFNELPFLSKAFHKVIIVPYDEFLYKENENRLSEFSNVEVYCVNKKTEKLSFNHLVKRELMVWRILCFELFRGREPINHFKFYKRNSSQIKHSFACAVALNKYLAENNISNYKLYNYWLHGGIIISTIMNKLVNKTNTNIVSRAHAYDVYHKDWYSIYPNSAYLFLAFEKWKLHHTEKIATISTHGYNHFVKLYPQYKDKLSVSRLGVIEQKSVSNSTKGNTLTWITCSNIDENKRVYRIPELISKMQMNVNWFHFGKESSQSDLAKLQDEINKYQIRDKCNLMGFKPNSEVISFYQNNNVDLILNLSQIEGIPVSLMEASSFGIPMVATNTVGNPEIVNNENGFLIDVEFNTDDLAKSLNAYFYNAELIEKKRSASKNTFLNYYDASKNYPEFIKTMLSN